MAADSGERERTPERVVGDAPLPSSMGTGLNMLTDSSADHSAVLSRWDPALNMRNRFDGIPR